MREIERKYVVTDPGVIALLTQKIRQPVKVGPFTKPFVIEMAPIKIDQFYVVKQDDPNVVVRFRREDKGFCGPTHDMTVKLRKSGLENIEICTSVSIDDWNDAYEFSIGHIKKTRVNAYFQIPCGAWVDVSFDLYDDRDLLVVEIECDSGWWDNPIVSDDIFKQTMQVIRSRIGIEVEPWHVEDVTDDPQYKNENLGVK